MKNGGVITSYKLSGRDFEKVEKKVFKKKNNNENTSMEWYKWFQSITDDGVDIGR